MIQFCERRGLSVNTQEQGGSHETVFDFVVSEVPLMPGESVTLQVELSVGFRKLSAVGMPATTNDGFFAVNAKHVFPKIGTRMAVANAYDAGSEANDEPVTISRNLPVRIHSFTLLKEQKNMSVYTRASMG